MHYDVAGVHIKGTLGSVLYAPPFEGTAVEEGDEAGLIVGLRCSEKRTSGTSGGEKTSSVHTQLIVVGAGCVQMSRYGLENSSGIGRSVRTRTIGVPQNVRCALTVRRPRA